ncbi:MAG: hypothetical protein FWE42_09570, partial [Defluviitaleaceae bacterium]|nr:hypothetical protein [Defluviitaleaceae bacterium]
MNSKNREHVKTSFKRVKPSTAKSTSIKRIILMLFGLLVVVGIAVFAFDNDTGGFIDDGGPVYTYIDDYGYAGNYDFDNNSDGYEALYTEGPEDTYIEDGNYEYNHHIRGYDYEGEFYHTDGEGFIGNAPEYNYGPYYNQESYDGYENGSGYGDYHEGGYIGFMPAGLTGTPIGPFEYWNGGAPVMDGAGLEAAISAAANLGFTRVIYIGANISMTANAATRDVIANRDIWIRSTTGENYVIMSSGTNRHFNVNGGGRLTLSNITLSRQIIDVVIDPPAAPINIVPPTGAGGGVLIGASGTLVMQNGANIRHNRATHGGGVDVNGAGARFHMNGGTIRNNMADGGYGGGVRVTGTTSRFYMNGGMIGGDHSTPHESMHHPSAGHSAADSAAAAIVNPTRAQLPFNNFARGGGGVSLIGGAQFIMNRPLGCICYSIPEVLGCDCTTPPGNGVIAGNMATHATDTAGWPGGGLRSIGHNTTTRMYGGAIRGNWSGNNGGGVLLRNTATGAAANRTSFHFIGGFIEDNFSARNITDPNTSATIGFGGGGGVAIGHNADFVMYDGATIRRNSAVTQGGGIRLRDDGARFTMHG